MKTFIALPFLSLAFLSLALIGCGGGDSSPGPTSQVTLDGIYANNDAVMLIDTALINGGVASNGAYILAFDGFTRSNNTLTFKGSNLWSTTGFDYDSTQTMTALFDTNSVQTAANINGVMFTYNLPKQPVSLPLEQLAGLYQDGGQITQINTNGQFSSYGNALNCTYTGKLQMTKGFYYSSEVNAEGCTNAANDGLYDGIFFTVNKSNQTNLLAVFYRAKNIIWGEILISNK